MTGIGRMLVEAREAKRVTLEQAERDTRIVRRYLEALEREDFATFPFEVYARGFLRSYASYLGLNGADLVALMPRSAQDTTEPRRQQRPPDTPRPIRQPSRPPPDPVSGRNHATPARTTSTRPPPAAATPTHPRHGTRTPSPGPTRRPSIAGSESPGALPALRVAAIVGAILATALLVGMLASGGDGSTLGGEGVTAPGAAGVPSRSSGQPPAAGTAVAGRMPELTGMDEETALARLGALGITPFVIEVPSREVPAGQVIRQSPAASSTIGQSTVTIVISRGG